MHFPFVSGGQMEVVAGRYEIQTELGRGGMGVVYLATDLTLGRKVALKRLKVDPAFLEGDEASKRFKREARLTSQLSCPSIVTLYDIIEEGEELFLVLEYYRSESLAALIESGGPMTEDELRSLGYEVATALAEAHQAGVVHRDVKPENILVGDRGAKLTDFGIARISEAGDHTTRLTKSGYYVGTPGYMSPEQAVGNPASPKSDVFAAGLVLYYALTGRDPFGRGTPAAVLYRIVHEELDLDSVDASSVLKAWIARAVAKDPDQRPTASELASALDPKKREFEPPAPAEASSASAVAAGVPEPAVQPDPDYSLAGAIPGEPSAGLSPPGGYAPFGQISPPGGYTPPGGYAPQTLPPSSKSHLPWILGCAGAVFVVFLLVAAAVVGVNSGRNVGEPPRTAEQYISPQGFSVVIPPGWKAGYDQATETDKIERDDGSAAVVVSAVSSPAKDPSEMSSSELVDTFLRQPGSLGDTLSFEDESVTVEKAAYYGGYPAIQIGFDFQLRDSSDGYIYSAALFVVDHLEKYWLVLQVWRADELTRSQADFRSIRDSFLINT